MRTLALAAALVSISTASHAADLFSFMAKLGLRIPAF
jgi:hypothetical protein